MTAYERSAQAESGPDAIKVCWLCGIHLPAGQMVADGGSACADIRWYCRNRSACTERWTTPRHEPAGRAGAAGTARPPGGPPPDLAVAMPSNGWPGAPA